MTMTREYFESLGNTYNPDSLYTNIDLSNTERNRKCRTNTKQK